MTPADDVVTTTVDDALFRDDHVLVMVGSEVMLLSPVTSEIVAACAGGLSRVALGQHLESKFGAPPQGTTVEEQTDLLVRSLTDVGVVSVTSAVERTE